MNRYLVILTVPEYCCDSRYGEEYATRYVQTHDENAAVATAREHAANSYFEANGGDFNVHPDDFFLVACIDGWPTIALRS